jgi:predicted nucleic acid-binding Zn ribbon protein
LWTLHSVALSKFLGAALMPSYDYYCATNGRTVEVRHGMNESLHTWKDVCKHAEIDLGDTAADAPVKRLISGGQFVSASALKNPEPRCGGGSCGGGMCGLN